MRKESRVANLKVVEPADVVEDHLLRGIEEQRVDREVAALRVLLRGPEDVVLRDQEIVGRSRRGIVAGDVGSDLDLRVLRGRLVGLAPERGGLDDVVAVGDVREAEAASDDARVAEQAPDLARVRARRDVEVLRDATDEQVADAAADEVGFEAVALEARDDAQRVLVEPALGDGLGRDGAGRGPAAGLPASIRCVLHFVHQVGAKLYFPCALNASGPIAARWRPPCPRPRGSSTLRIRSVGQ